MASAVPPALFIASAVEEDNEKHVKDNKGNNNYAKDNRTSSASAGGQLPAVRTISICLPDGGASASAQTRKLSMSGNTFQLTIHITNADTNASIAFKQDGQRFGTSPRTYKFQSDATYKCRLLTRPPIEFHNMHLAGSDIRLVGAPGDYTAIWKTTGIDVTRKGARQDILFVLNSPDGSLRKTFQSKFYVLGDTHADYGHKMESLQWTCEIDAPSGTITVKDETVL